MRKSMIVKIVVFVLSMSAFVCAASHVSLTLTANTNSVAPGEQVDYTLTINCTSSSWIFMTREYITLPSGFTYVSGSTSGLTNSDPSINGDELRWFEWYLLYPGETLFLKFSALASTTPGTYGTIAQVNGYRMNKTTIGPTANVTVEDASAPLLVLNKSVDKSTGLPGEQLTYSVTYMNSGDGVATDVKIYEPISPTTDYIAGTAAGNNMLVTYSHDGGNTFDSQEISPITDLLFTLNGNLAVGGSGVVTYKVVVK